MTRREANLLSALVLFLLGLGLALSAPRWARFLREPVASIEDEIVGGVERTRGEAGEEKEGRRTISVKLYFPDAERGGLLGEEREVAFSPEASLQIRSVIEELLKGPRTALLPAFGPGTRVLEVFVNARGVAYVDLSAEVRPLPGAGSQGELLSVYALVNSVVANFPVVKRVQLLVDDKPVETLGGHVDLSRPLLPDMTFLVQPSASPTPSPAEALPTALDPGRVSIAIALLVGMAAAAAVPLAAEPPSPLARNEAQAAKAPPAGRKAAPRESPVAAAERKAREALALLPAQPAAALAAARTALELTADFEPTAFVRAGRKGEVVEDAYLAARATYRVHRGSLYEAVGLALAASGHSVAAVRYLRRAVDLDAGPERTTGLVRTLLAQGRGREALIILERAFSTAAPPPENVVLLQQAVDLVGLPSAQVELDRVRLRTVAGARHVDGPISFPPNLRLSTNPVFRPDDAPVNVLYAAEASCRTCSADLAELKRLVLPPARVLLVPESLEQDRALRQVVDLYRFGFPLLLGKGLLETLALSPRNVLVVARGGWSGAALTGPWTETLPAALAILGRRDVEETLPRAGWNHVPPSRGTAGALPGLLPEGLAPGEEAPPPPDFAAALEAYRARQFAEALRGFEAVEARGDGFLLPPEARLNRALCLAGLGRREEARKLLLKTGDSRVQEDVDRALETVGSPKR